MASATRATGRVVAVAVCALSTACLDGGDWSSHTLGLAGGKQEVAEESPVARVSVMFTTRSTIGATGCSATILDDAHALTAAHCTFGLDGVPDPVLVFATEVTAESTTRDVVDFFTPSDDLEQDIAVLEFDGGLPEGAEAVVLAPKLELAKTVDMIHAGYGIVSEEVDGRGTLRQTTGRFEASLSKGKRYRARGGAVCSGDSGGPDLMVGDGRLIQTGVHVSGDCDTIVISTDVRKYVDFIESTGASPEIDVDTTVPEPPGPDTADCAGADCGCVGDECEPADGGCSATGAGGAWWLVLAAIAVLLLGRRAARLVAG